MNRPQVTPELVATVAATFCSSHGWDASQADDLARAYRRNPGAHVLVLLRAGNNARLALAVGDGRRVYAMTCPQPEDMYAGFARVEGSRWGSINGPVLVWAHDNHPHEMAAFIGPPEAVINV